MRKENGGFIRNLYYGNLIGVLLLAGGCATISTSAKNLWNKVSGKDDAAAAELAAARPEPKPVKYSENPQMSVPANHLYRRMTREKLEEESELHAQAGSMWVPEGQGAYLFVQNKARREGDLLNVKLDSPALKQIETKVNIIKKLLKQLEEQQIQDAQMKLALAQGATAGAVSSVAPAGGAVVGAAPSDRTPAATPAGANSPGVAPPVSSASNDKAKSEKEDKTDLSEVQNVQTRIVERLGDGNYRIKGQQPFMIDKREYKVIVTGLIRSEDFSDEGVISSKLVDSQIDVVSVRRAIQ